MLGLQNSVIMDVVFPNRTDNEDPEGANHWQFAPERIALVTGIPLPECTYETATGHNFRLIRDIYNLEGSTERPSQFFMIRKITALCPTIALTLSECSIDGPDTLKVVFQTKSAQIFILNTKISDLRLIF